MTQAILAQLLIAVRGVTESFDVVEELAVLKFARHNNRGRFVCVCEIVKELELSGQN